MAMRLAHQIERIFDAEALVALPRPGGLTVMGVGLRSDRRQLNSTVPGDSALARAMERPDEAPFRAADPLGGVVADRRSPDQATVLPVMDAGEAVGAVALRLSSGQIPAGEPWQELTRALAAAGPRLRAGLEARRAVDASVQDPLTGLLNRRGFEQVMRRIGARDGALVMLDLDRFKSLNDTLGHPAGDAALQMVARLLQAQIRDGDAVGRLGGEEMAVWLPGAALEQGLEIAERIRTALQSTAWVWEGRSWPVTASLGVAACPGTTSSPENLMTQADRALYSAKQGGRNRVESGER
jgi:diguanylate cyclase (GGDEF)-like protein